MTTRERDSLRKLQDRFLRLVVVQKFVAEHGIRKFLWEGGPSADEVRDYICPKYRVDFEHYIAKYPEITKPAKTTR
jgi:hypothetical protein